MARGFNSVYLIGTLTEKPNLEYTPGGLAILRLNLAGSDRVLGDDGQLRDIAWYQRATVFDKQAEYLADQLEQGSPVFVDGRLNYRTWEDQSGQRRSALDIRAIRVDVLTYGPRKGEATVLDAKGQPRLMNALNQVAMIGNLTRDGELRYTPNGNAVTQLGIALNERYRDRRGQDQETTHFVDVDVWGELAESCGELAKGDPVMVVGSLITDSWTDKDGNARFKNKVRASRVEFLTRGPGGGGAGARPEAKEDDRASQRLDIDEEFPPEEDLPF
jgi:single-strand DNA-binding protein